MELQAPWCVICWLIHSFRMLEVRSQSSLRLRNLTWYSYFQYRYLNYQIDVVEDGPFCNYISGSLGEELRQHVHPRVKPLCFHPLLWKPVNHCFTETHHWSSNICVPGYKRGYFLLSVLCWRPVCAVCCGSQFRYQRASSLCVRISACSAIWILFRN